MQKYLVEFMGTLLLSFVIFSTNNYLAIGAALALGVYLGGPISSAAYNPAIAITLLSAGKISQNDLIPYILAEIAGGMAGFELAKRVLNRKI